VGLNFGDNTVEPHPSNEVFSNRYGDCKDLGLLALQMLKVAGIEAHMALFSHEFTGDPKASLPNPSVFTHAILQVMVDGQKYFVDPQLKGFDLGQYPASYDNAHVFVITDEGYQFDNLPVLTEDQRSLNSQADITVRPDGSALFNVNVKLSVETSQSFRNTWESSTKEDKDKFFENLEHNFTKGGKMIDRSLKGIKERYGPVEFDLRYESPNAYPLVNDMILIREEDQSELPSFAQEKRLNPIFVPSNTVIKNQNTYHVPEGFKVSFVPSNYSLGIDFMDVSVNYLNKDATVEINSLFRTKRATMPVERYAQIRDFRKELFKKMDQYIVFKKNADISPEAKDWVKSQ
jgi:hypothetical protein